MDSQLQQSTQTLITPPQKDFELLDSGDGQKLERWGIVTLIRPEPEALWKKRLPTSTWEKATATYVRTGETGLWKGKSLPTEWPIQYGNTTFVIKPTSFKHTGLFPEQLPHWYWVSDLIKKANRPINILNLFAYTGGATLHAAQAGASVCHLDSSKKAVAWARENADQSKLSKKPIRWIIEDALTFLTRESKRGVIYDGIILDPPAFGHGPKDELWKIERDFSLLIQACASVLSKNPLFMLINGYSAGYSPITFRNVLEPLCPKQGILSCGENTIQESGENSRLLPVGVFARWSNTTK